MMNNNTIATNTIDEENAHNYEEGAPDTRKVVSSIRVSALPQHIRASALKLDVNHDGALCTEEIADAISDLDKKERTNRNLKMTVSGVIVLCVLLIAAIFGSSIAAASLAKDVTVDHDNGFAYVKGSHDVMKTSEAIVYQEGMVIPDMSNDELVDLKMIILNEGNIRFDIKGFARNENDDTIILLTEGGSLTYNFEGIIYSTGQARAILEAMFGEEIHVEDSDGQRELWCACSLVTCGTTQTNNKKNNN
jgi:hypothetical protein